ncbi:MAG TPA: cupin domain-containing protein [Gemmatimonadaceae bacterium]|nr:cupin domain-containing protein [Gemmatimonadaceae bacterium]
MQVYSGTPEKGDREKFHNDVWLKRFVDLPDDSVRVFVLHFTPGARTNWHVHAGRQVMYVLFGEGCVQEWSGKAAVVRPGDVVYLEPGVKHWHGAAPNADFIHSTIAFDRETYWKFRREDSSGAVTMSAEPVSEADYDAAFSHL